MLVLRAHYTMDVFAAALAAFFALVWERRWRRQSKPGLRRASDRAGKR